MIEILKKVTLLYEMFTPENLQITAKSKKFRKIYIGKQHRQAL